MLARAHMTALIRDKVAQNSDRISYNLLTSSSTTSSPIIPMQRHIRNTGTRLKMEAQDLQAQLKGRLLRLHHDYTQYGSSQGDWRKYINESLPSGVAPHRSARIAVLRFR